MKKLMIVALVATAAFGAYAEKTAGFQLSLTPDIAIQDRDTRINGVSIGVWNENPQSAWSIGMVNGSTGDSKGFSWLPYLTFLNYAENYKGVHWGWVNYTSGDFAGWQDGLVNWTAGSFVGFQSGLLNYAGEFKGFQWGIVNICQDLTGLQLSLVNYAKHSTSGVQLGLVNIIPENEWFSDGDLAQGMILLNWGF